jgi:hypothetical protein
MSIYKFDSATDYSGKELFSMLKDVDVPEYVKTAEIDDPLELRALPKAAFADPERGIYPVNTPARVYVSNAYFINKRADIANLYGEDYACQLETNIKTAADIFGISEDLESYNSEFNEKQASDYEARPMMQLNVLDNVIELYPVKTAADLSEAADNFAKNIQKFPMPDRVKTAQNMVVAASEMGVEDLPELVLKYAGLYYPDLANLEREIWRRSTKLEKQANKDIYKRLADDVENISSIDEVMKLAETLYNIETMEGLYEKRAAARELGDPVDCIFTRSVEKVAEDLAFVEVHGDKYKLADLTKVSKDKYEEAFGFEVDPSDAEKLAEILPTMPRSDVKLFEEISGVRPV